MAHPDPLPPLLTDIGFSLTEIENIHIYVKEGERSGTGLGLFIANHIVDQHGGTIDVTSTPGMGTNFKVMIPIF